MLGMHASPRLLLGGYTTTARRGVELWSLASVSMAAEVAVLDPSWLVPLEGGFLAVGETTPSGITAVGLPGDELRGGKTLELSGSLACHAAVSGPTGDGVSHVVVAHYGSGSVSVVRCERGVPVAQTDHLVLSGSGPNRARQEAPHAHQVVMHDGEAWVCDLGSDRIHRLGIGADGRVREVAEAIELPAGSGPRHLVAAGGRVVVVGELVAELFVLRPHGAGWVVESSTPSTASSSAEPSALRAGEDGLIWTANRGPGTIAVHRLVDGRLEPVSEVPCGGRWPRDLVLDGDLVWVACQLSDEVVGLDRAAVVRGVPPFVRARIPSLTPSCVLPVSAG